MQLNQGGMIREGLALAVCVLLTGAPAQAYDIESAAEDSATGSTNLGVLSYQEGDGRIKVSKYQANVRNVWSEDSEFSIDLSVDSLSGGSPNGALPSRSVQTFATPSGRSLQKPVKKAPTVQTCTTPSGTTYNCTAGSSEKSSIYDVSAGQLPMDNSFSDKRQAISMSYGGSLAPSTRLALGGAFSTEADYQSLSANVALTQSFNQKNTTLSLGVNVERDSSSPVGGTPLPLSNYALFQRQGDQTKAVNDVLLGVTQVMTRRWLTRLNLSADNAQGYHNDPYKIVSALDSTGRVVGYLYENRPDQRSRRSLYWENRYALDRDTITASVRAMRDDWGMNSKTVDLRYRYVWSDGGFIEPHLRWYTQTAADFYRLYVMQGDPYLKAVSADSRLGGFTAKTVGVKLGYEMSRDSVFSLRFERYQQTGEVNMAGLPQLQGLDLNPGLSATIVSADLQFKF
ncbi:MAG: DUF3570 domain-containing protein [Fluviicoccus sp.]|uniref:DUF3570 domain-containing protein n=1 Tax=Fluviicoccus sp. TaxID=2003552 RepID=UPI00271DA7D7|nr:DUF3570 domain-containing protein [Fluviicoccus sp.]MDO8332065.1 DUF3570 domain-containing protein [Fluviicoccus sp.]